MSYIMIVDDDDDFSFATATVLEEAGYEVRVESNIPGAEASLKTKQPDLLILDAMFPENSSAGFELARKIRQSDETIKHVPILMLTAVNSKFPLGFCDKDIDDAYMPVEDFLEKPVDFDVLKNRVNTLLKNRSSCILK
ncbi:MAG: response regulator [Geobacteraceae bacterium]|jgi:DNA-binding response OmpR family regulator